MTVQSVELNLIFPHNIQNIPNRVSVSVDACIKNCVLSFALPFDLTFVTKPPNNAFPHDAVVKRNDDVFVYVLRFQPIDFDKFTKNWELHVAKSEPNDGYEEISKEMDERMDEYERKEKTGKKKKIVDEDGWVRYE